jgi:hypothetical protein
MPIAYGLIRGLGVVRAGRSRGAALLRWRWRADRRDRW